MPEPAYISAKTGKGLRAVALMVVLCLLCAVGWSVAASAGQGAEVDSAAVNSPAKVPSGAGSDSRDGNPPPGKFYLPRQLFIEVSRTAPRDPLVPQMAPLAPLPPAFTVVWEQLAPAGTWWGIPSPAEGVGRATPRTPTGPPYQA
jgi:hypothetical protein